jgi:hypothetical protein
MTTAEDAATETQIHNSTTTGQTSEKKIKPSFSNHENAAKYTKERERE